MIREPAREIVRELVPLSSQLLDRLDVIDVNGLHKIAEVAQASFELIFITSPHILVKSRFMSGNFTPAGYPRVNNHPSQVLTKPVIVDVTDAARTPSRLDQIVHNNIPLFLAVLHRRFVEPV